MTTYEEWRVTGHIQGKPYEFTWSPFQNPHLGDPERGARTFLELTAKSELNLQRRIVTVADWEEVSTDDHHGA